MDFQEKIATGYYTKPLPTGRPKFPKDPFDKAAREEYERAREEWDAKADERAETNKAHLAARAAEFDVDVLAHLGLTEHPKGLALLSLAKALAEEAVCCDTCDSEGLYSGEAGFKDYVDMAVRLTELVR